MEQIKILGAVLELPAKQHCQFRSSKMAPTAIGAKPSFYMKFIANSFLASVLCKLYGAEFVVPFFSGSRPLVPQVVIKKS